MVSQPPEGLLRTIQRYQNGFVRMQVRTMARTNFRKEGWEAELASNVVVIVCVTPPNPSVTNQAPPLAGRPWSTWLSWEIQGLFPRFQIRSQAFWHFPPPCKTVTVSSDWFAGAHRRATDAKCYFKDPFNQLFNDYLLQGTVLGTMESTWKIRPKSLPSRSLQSSWEDKAYIQGKLSNNTGVELKCKITVQETSKSSTWLNY